MIIAYTLRKTKWIRLSKLTKTREFNELWYSPDNPGGKLAKNLRKQALELEKDEEEEYTYDSD